MNTNEVLNKLIAELRRKKHELELSIQSQGDYGQSSHIVAYENIISKITSLQQEQPEGLHFTPLNRLIQKIPSEKWNDTVNNYAKKLRDCLIKEGYLKDAKALQCYISYMNGNNVPMATMDEQEQPEVDLEKELDRYLRGEFQQTAGGNFNNYIQVARHFYELGVKARKEE